MLNTELRKSREVEQGRRIAGIAERIWKRDTRAGHLRMQNRFKDLATFFSATQGNLLELGCGTGTWTEHLQELPIAVTSIDLSPHLLEIARSRFAQRPVKFIEMDAEHLSFPDRTFDFICGLSVLHHLNVDATLNELKRVAKPSARVWFSEPNMLNPQIAVQKNIPIIKRWSGDTPDETAFFRWSLTKRFEKAGFQDVQIIPIDFLHPAVPDRWAERLNRWNFYLEKAPLLREIAGSLLVHARA